MDEYWSLEMRCAKPLLAPLPVFREREGALVYINGILVQKSLIPVLCIFLVFIYVRFCNCEKFLYLLDINSSTFQFPFF